tara:strand:+ start:313 stop:468 length:156 start_codon:yes stop_codon:yes gene_type:complete
MREWELSMGFYPGIIVGFRSYEQEKCYNHVLYLPFIDICLTVLKNVNEPDK